MPITFPDGTTAELRYTRELALERFSVYPDTFAAGGPQACGSSVHATRYDPRVGYVIGSEPLAQFTRADGSIAEVWEGEPLSEPHDYLLIRFDSWTVVVPCRWHGDWDREEVSVWSENLHGRESTDGMLVLTATPPLEVHPYEGSPTVRFSTDDLVLDLTVAPEECRRDSNDRGAGDGTVQWCIQPSGGIWLYATMFTATAKAEKVLQGLVEDLQVLNVRSPK